MLLRIIPPFSVIHRRRRRRRSFHPQTTEAWSIGAADTQLCEAKQNPSYSTEGLTLRVKFVLLENKNAYKHHIHITTILFASAQLTALQFSGRRLKKDANGRKADKDSEAPEALSERPQRNAPSVLVFFAFWRRSLSFSTATRSV